MIKRIVKLTFRQEHIDEFLDIFKENRSKIMKQQGCHHVELMKDINQPNTYFTYSLWDSESSLNEYRDSELFKAVWKKTKKLFSERAAAWSVMSISSEHNEN